MNFERPDCALQKEKTQNTISKYINQLENLEIKH